VRVAAGKDQTQPVVLQAGALRDIRVFGLMIQPVGELRERRVEAGAAAKGVDGLEAADRDEPGAGVVRHPALGPLLQRRREGVVQRVLGEVEVAQQADQGGEDATRVGTVDLTHHLARDRGRSPLHAVRACHTPMLTGAVADTTPGFSERWWIGV
jgi:hypothetical protein